MEDLAIVEGSERDGGTGVDGDLRAVDPQAPHDAARELGEQPRVIGFAAQRLEVAGAIDVQARHGEAAPFEDEGLRGRDGRPLSRERDRVGESIAVAAGHRREVGRSPDQQGRRCGDLGEIGATDGEDFASWATTASSGSGAAASGVLASMTSGIASGGASAIASCIASCIASGARSSAASVMPASPASESVMVTAGIAVPSALASISLSSQEPALPPRGKSDRRPTPDAQGSAHAPATQTRPALQSPSVEQGLPVTCPAAPASFDPTAP